MKGGVHMVQRSWVEVVGLLGAAAALALLAPDPAFAQCAMCRDAVASSSPATREAMNYAIIGLAAAPYGIAALAAWVLSPTVRRELRSRIRRFRGRAAGS